MFVVSYVVRYSKIFSGNKNSADPGYAWICGIKFRTFFIISLPQLEHLLKKEPSLKVHFLNKNPLLSS